MQAERDSLAREVATLKRKNAQLAIRFRDQQTSNEGQLQERIDKIEATHAEMVRDLREKLETAEEERMRLQQANISLQGKVRSAGGDVDEEADAGAAPAADAAELEALKAKLATMEKEKDELEDEVATFELQLIEAKQRENEHGRRVTDAVADALSQLWAEMQESGIPANSVEEVVNCFNEHAEAAAAAATEAIEEAQAALAAVEGGAAAAAAATAVEPEAAPVEDAAEADKENAVGGDENAAKKKVVIKKSGFLAKGKLLAKALGGDSDAENSASSKRSKRSTRRSAGTDDAGADSSFEDKPRKRKAAASKKKAKTPPPKAKAGKKQRKLFAVQEAISDDESDISDASPAKPNGLRSTPILRKMRTVR